MDRSVLNRSKRRDRIARRVITLGGFLIIASVIAILVMIARTALPLFFPSRATLQSSLALPAGTRPESVLAVDADEYRETGIVLDAAGAFSFFKFQNGALLNRQLLVPPSPRARALRAAQPLGRQAFALFWDDGSLSVEKVKFTPQFDGEGGARRMTHAVERQQVLPPAPGQPAPLLSIARASEDGRLTRLDALPNNCLAVTQLIAATNLLGETTSETKHLALTSDLPSAFTALAVDQAGRTLFAGHADGMLERWSLENPEKPELTDKVKVTDGGAVTALAFVLGDISLAVGDASGRLSTWFMVPTGPTERALRRIHDLHPHPCAITAIITSPRDKSILSLDAAGHAHLDHMTSERHLLELAPARPLRLAAIASRADGLIGLDAAGRLLDWNLHNAHPEVSFKTLFGKVWYENYPQPEYVWQSSSASQDFEAKLSLVPLLFGTLKGTFYALLLAVPLAVLGALYTSQFMRPGLRAVVKPLIEVMSAIPSVVIGFLAALWLAPRVEHSIVGIFLSVVSIPACLIAALALWQLAERLPLARKLGHGHEFLILVPVLLAGAALALWLGPIIEHAFFGGSFGQWLFNSTGARYDQRNCIIIAFALGFAVIPIVFTIADDSLSNIPRSLTAASLALGASRWQTAWRVILPSASPGIFAGVMIGLGRAVGETMIVLMATGNTPIIDPGPFNGMRTLSANIAVEIPEAPFGGTLYRVLFLTAVLLFLTTFLLNTAAELVRQRLRRKYSQL